ncbi:MAG: SDR family NAD(P)-dependent oxidoreductase [Myxococcales bacterium]|nr:SDR family NAD(P)-dependent oxidoreductase [Myxococcales bacterium]
MKLNDLKIIVTGAASGMGRYFTQQLAAEGASVAAWDLSEEGLAAVAEENKGAAGTVKTFVANVADEKQVVAAIKASGDGLGGLNGLINNAGIFRDGLLVKVDKKSGDVKKMSLEQWQSVIDVDLTGPFLATRELAAYMIENKIKPGVIVNMSSVSRSGNMGQSNYSAAKAGLVADTKLWGHELARYGIRVGAIAPGFVRTPILDAMRPEVLEKMVQGVPLRRVGEPHEIYLGVKFIIECDYFTSRCLDIDGGTVL